MAGDADPDTSILAAHSAAVASLRDTAKWLVGGVTATAAGIFAGSSLTNLGSLDFQTHAPRLGLAIAGIVLGFAGLALILVKAIAVLTVESVDFPALAKAKGGALKRTVKKLEDRYKGLLPGSAKDLAELCGKAEQSELGTTDADKAFMTEFLGFLPPLMAEGTSCTYAINLVRWSGRSTLALRSLWQDLDSTPGPRTRPTRSRRHRNLPC